VELEGGVQGGVGRRRDDGADDAPRLHLGEQLGGGYADGVGQRIDQAERGDGRVVGEVDGGGGAEGEGLCDVIF
jgi:hypothetical protein